MVHTQGEKCHSRTHAIYHRRLNQSNQLSKSKYDKLATDKHMGLLEEQGFAKPVKWEQLGNKLP